MNVTTETMPQKVAVTRCRKSWLLTINLDIDETDDGYRADSFTVEISHKPTNADIHSAIIEHVNAATDAKILSGLTWNGCPVWLSTENQLNSEVAYNRAVRTQGASLPVTFKLGERDGTPVYHTFATVSEMESFHDAVAEHIQRCVADGWQRKDSITL